ncbi:MAG: hypothetical protein IH934_03945 [Nanoarchaeota archaeon]|nr:hypothetical protein [Nanoarchaeota archaeon]
MADLTEFVAEFDNLTESITKKAVKWLEENGIVCGPIQPLIKNVKYVDFDLKFSKNKKNLQLMKQKLNDSGNDPAEAKRMSNLLFITLNFEFAENRITIHGATFYLSEFLCACEETRNFIKKFLASLEPRLLGIRNEADEDYRSIFINRNVIMPLCPMTRDKKVLSQIRYRGEKTGCFYGLHKEDIKRLVKILHRYPKIWNKKLGERLLTLFKEDTTVNEFILSEKEVEEFLKIICDILKVPYNKGYYWWKKIFKRPDFQDLNWYEEIIIEQDNRDDDWWHKIFKRYELNGYDWHSRILELQFFLMHIVDKHLSLKIIKNENKEL